MARNNKKDIDFLSVYNAKKTVNVDKKTILYITLPVLLVLVFTISTIFFVIKNDGLEKDNELLQEQILELTKANASNTNIDKQKEASELQAKLTNLQNIQKALAQYEQIDQATLQVVSKSCKNLTIDSTSFNQTTGELTFTVTASRVNGCEQTVRTLRESGQFASVDYSGYSQEGGVSETTETVTDPTTGETTTQTVTNTTPITYKSTIKCVIGGGSTNE